MFYYEAFCASDVTCFQVPKISKGTQVLLSAASFQHYARYKSKYSAKYLMSHLNASVYQLFSSLLYLLVIDVSPVYDVSLVNIFCDVKWFPISVRDKANVIWCLISCSCSHSFGLVTSELKVRVMPFCK